MLETWNDPELLAVSRSFRVTQTILYLNGKLMDVLWIGFHPLRLEKNCSFAIVEFFQL